MPCPALRARAAPFFRYPDGMKIEKSITAAAPPGPEARVPFRFTLEQGSFAGQSFAATLDICANPCCPCGAVGFVCRRDNAPGEPLSFDLDVFERQLNTQVQSAPTAVALGRAFVAEAQPTDWEWLRHFFLATKRRQMETMDLDTLNVQLPGEAISGDGTMVGYVEIFPWAEPFEFTRDGQHWFVDDQHCVEPGCDCTQSCLAFCPVPVGNVRATEPTRCSIALYYDYCNAKFKVVEAQHGSPAPAALLQGLRAANPGLAETLRHRHGQLKQLGRRLMPKARRSSKRPLPDVWRAGRISDESVPATPSVGHTAKAGRNDPCPCGSGRKYKKCCGAV